MEGYKSYQRIVSSKKPSFFFKSLLLRRRLRRRGRGGRRSSLLVVGALWRDMASLLTGIADNNLIRFKGSPLRRRKRSSVRGLRRSRRTLLGRSLGCGFSGFRHGLSHLFLFSRKLLKKRERKTLSIRFL